MSPKKNAWKPNEPPRKRPYNVGHENVTVKLAELQQKIENVARHAQLNTSRIEANEKNSRALNIILKPFPKKDPEGNFIEPIYHLRAMLTDAYGFEKKLCDEILDDISKITTCTEPTTAVLRSLSAFCASRPWSW